MSGNIHFVQYLRPDGRKSLVHIERPGTIVQVADRILRYGFWFECELLSTGQVSLTISDKNGDYAIELCKNGPGVAETVDKLILGFNIPNALKERATRT